MGKPSSLRLIMVWAVYSTKNQKNETDEIAEHDEESCSRYRSEGGLLPMAEPVARTKVVRRSET